MTPQEIKKYRIQLGLKKTQLAKLTGVSRVQIGRIESTTCKPENKRKPDKGWLILFKKILEEKGVL